jgi:hypothetical protein
MASKEFNHKFKIFFNLDWIKDKQISQRLSKKTGEKMFINIFIYKFLKVGFNNKNRLLSNTSYLLIYKATKNEHKRIKI